RHTSFLGKGIEAHVEERRNADEALWGDGGRELGHHVLGDRQYVDTGVARSRGDGLHLLGYEEHLEAAGFLERFGDRLRPLNQETDIVFPERALLEPRCGSD